MPLWNAYPLSCRLGLVLLLTGILAACAAPSPQSSAVEVAPLAPPPVAASTPVGKSKIVRGRTIVVQPGASLGRIAETYHASKQAIIAANRLSPPYELKTGSRLVIPATGAKAVAAAPAAKSEAKPVQMAHAAAKSKAAGKPTKAGSGSGDIIPLD